MGGAEWEAQIICLVGQGAAEARTVWWLFSPPEEAGHPGGLPPLPSPHPRLAWELQDSIFMGARHRSFLEKTTFEGLHERKI